MHKIMLADDHELVREMIADYLVRQGKFDVQCVDNLDNAFELNRRSGPFDLILLDYSMPGMEMFSGFEAMRETVDCPVAILSGTAPPDVAHLVLEAGAAGFIPKTLRPRDLLLAVRRMLSGEVYRPEGFLSPDDAGERISLTARQKDVLRGLCEGKSNKEIARELDIQEVTVKLHIKTLSRKLGARNRTHAAMLSRNRGLI